MTLHDAIQQLLIDSKKELTTLELAKLINERQLYLRKDKKPVTASQVMSRIGNYPKLFTKIGNKVSLKGFNKEDLYEEEIKNDLKKFVNHLYHSYSFRKSSILPFVIRSIIEVDNHPEGIGNANRFFESISRDVEFKKSFNYTDFNILPEFLEIIFKIQRHSNRNKILQKIIYWLNDSGRGSDLMILPEYLCSIIGGYNLYREYNMLYTTENMLNNFKLNIFEEYPNYAFDHTFTDLWANEDVVEINELLLRATLTKNTSKFSCWVERIGIITPPWGMRGRNYRWSSNFVTIMEAIDNYDKPLLDKALLVVPEGAIFGGGKDLEARNILTQGQYIESVVSIPFNANYTGIKSAVLITFNFSTRIENVFLADLNQLEKFDIETDWKRVNTIVNNKKVIPVVSTIVSTTDILDQECSWLPQKYIFNPSVFERKKDHQTISIKEVLVNWYKGKNIDRKILYEGGELKYLRTSDLSDKSIFINISDKALGIDHNEINHSSLSLKNSIVVSLIGKKLKASVIPGEVALLFNTNLAVLEVESDKIIPEFLAHELREPYIQQQLEYYRKGTTMPTISLRDFLELLVQVPSLDVQKDVLLELNRETSEIKESKDRDDLSKMILHNYLGIIKHTMKQPLATLSEDINSISRYLKLKADDKIISLNDFIIDLLPGEHEDDNEQSKLINTLNRLNRAVNDAHWRFEQSEKLLQIETSDVTLRKENVTNVLKETVTNYPDIKFKVKGKNVNTLLDKNLWFILIDNLVDNARKHGFIEVSNPKILFEVKTQKREDGSEEIVISYYNNGKPLPSNFNVKKFIRNGITSNKEAGDGFGGYLINSIIKKHNGRIEVLPSSDLELDKFNVCFKIYLNAI